MKINLALKQLNNKYSDLAVKFASQLSSQKIIKKTKFNFYRHLIIFTANQTRHKKFTI